MADDTDDIIDAQADTGADVATDIEPTQLAESQSLEQGDYSNANDLAQQAESTVNAAGDAVDPALANDVQSEASNTDWASWNQATANDNATWAASYANAGDADHAAEYQAIADDHQATADDYAHTADVEIADESADTGS